MTDEKRTWDELTVEQRVNVLAHYIWSLCKDADSQIEYNNKMTVAVKGLSDQTIELLENEKGLIDQLQRYLHIGRQRKWWKYARRMVEETNDERD